MTKTSCHPNIQTSDDPLVQAKKWRSEGRQVAIATVINTWGSSPRPIGSQMAMNELGSMVGSVSGGCIEGSVVVEALKVISDGKPITLEFGVSNEKAWEVGLACGGKIEIFIENIE